MFSIFKTEPGGPKTVPQPTVPTLIEGIGVVISKSSLSLVLQIVMSIKY